MTQTIEADIMKHFIAIYHKVAAESPIELGSITKSNPIFGEISAYFDSTYGDSL